MRIRIGTWLWIATALQVVAQVVAAAKWPGSYSLTDNAISDLGVTRCGTYDEGGPLARPVCSPWHAVFNGGMVLTGLLFAAGSLLLLPAWDGRARAAMVAMAVSGGLVALVGLVPWDRDPELHDTLALGQGLAQWLGMVLLAAATRGATRWVTWVVLAVSVVAFGVFVAELDGTDVPGIAWGAAERLSFDTLTLWTVVVAVLVLRRGSAGAVEQRREVGVG